MISRIRTRIAQVGDISGIVRVTNEAFLADAFFKKPQFIQRFTEEDVLCLMQGDKAAFLLAEEENSSDSIAGSIFLQWENETVDGFSKVFFEFMM